MDTPIDKPEPRLPPEVIMHIISFMEKSAQMRNLIGVNHFLTNEAERQSVYRHVHVSRSSINRKGQGAPYRRFASAVRAKPQRAAYVKSLVLDLNASSYGADDADETETTAPGPNGMGRELDIVAGFTNLQSLTIYHAATAYTTSSSSSTPNPSSDAALVALALLTRCRFPHLTHFSSSSYSLNDTSFRAFLAGHPGILSLGVGVRKAYSMAFGMPSSFPGPESGILPRLETLEGHWSNVVRLVRGRRSVRYVSMRSANVASYVPRARLRAILKAIAASSVEGDDDEGIRGLTLHVRHVDGDVVDLVAGLLPGLAALHLVDCSLADRAMPTSAAGARHAVDEDELGDEFYRGRAESVALALQSFVRLEELGITWPLGSTRVIEQRERRDVELFGAALPYSLSRISVGGRAWTKQAEEWVRTGMAISKDRSVMGTS